MYNFKGDSNNKDVLYCDVSDGCCHRLKPWCPAFSDIFSLFIILKGTLYQKAEIFLHLPFSLDSLERQLFGEVCQFSHRFVSDLLNDRIHKCCSLQQNMWGLSQFRVRKQWIATHSNLYYKISKSCHVLFSYDDDDDDVIDDTIWTVEEWILKSRIVFLKWLIDSSVVGFFK